MAEPYSMIVIGDGWRSRFLCRMAQAVPDRLRVNLVAGHHADRLEAIARDYGVPTSADADADAVAATAADFVAVVVSCPATPGLVAQLAEQGRYVYCETPPAPDGVNATCQESVRQWWLNAVDMERIVSS